MEKAYVIAHFIINKTKSKQYNIKNTANKKAKCLTLN